MEFLLDPNHVKVARSLFYETAENYFPDLLVPDETGKRWACDFMDAEMANRIGIPGICNPEWKKILISLGKFDLVGNASFIFEDRGSESENGSDGFAEERTVCLIIHELSHAKGGLNHGPEWQDCMEEVRKKIEGKIGSTGNLLEKKKLKKLHKFVCCDLLINITNNFLEKQVMENHSSKVIRIRERIYA